MKTYRMYSELPSPVFYLGSEDNGCISESLADALDEALAPVCLVEGGTRHYFDTAH